ncbi:transcriptional regulator [Actinomadura terrae]|uniref:transcriptional regulator n=1 Tax=Actinomadura terrae TaxID=604353 RepID=UPI001FA7E835|nr:transcriptional regulator [Actinomadura terrae]
MSTSDKKAIGARLRELREEPRDQHGRPHRSREKWALVLRSAAGAAADELPGITSLAKMIQQWERGDHVPGPIYRPLYARATGKPEAEIFGGEPTPAHLWRPDGLTSAVTPDNEDRLKQVSLRPARLDVATLEALAAVLAGQRRLEDAMGPAALLGPVARQLDALAFMLRDARGPLRDRLGRIVAEWTVYVGWLNAALRRDEQALALFGRGEELADDVEDGTISTLATSFRGYVARQQGRPRALVRAAMAALATPGGHPAQRTFDELQAAQGYAALGEREQAQRLLGEAAERAENDVDPPPPVYWYSPAFFRLYIGMMHRDIGEYSAAAALLIAGLDGLPADQLDAEWLGEYRAALTEARERA